MQVNLGWRSNHRLDLRRLVGRGVVDHHMDVEVVGYRLRLMRFKNVGTPGPGGVGEIGDDLARGNVEAA